MPLDFIKYMQMTATPTPMPISTALDALRAAGEEANADALADVLAPDVVFHSPMTGTKVFRGMDEVLELHRDIFAVVEDIVTTEPVVLGDTGSFTFRAHVRGVDLEAMNRVRVDEHGRIVEYTVFLRPLPALATLFAALPPRVVARRRGRLVAAVVTSLARPLAVVYRMADRMVPKLL